MSRSVYILDPFHAGSHKQLIDFLVPKLQDEDVAVHIFTLPAKKWQWRARTSALNFSQMIPKTSESSMLFCSSVLNLAELLALRPDLNTFWKKKIVYFHENQFVYPIRREGKRGNEQRDFQYGYNQVLTAMVADIILFNSEFNRSSFLKNLNSFFNLQPDCKPDVEAIRTQIEEKSSVLHFPVKIPNHIWKLEHARGEGVLRIVWPHRWEHDKNPGAFFNALFKLKEAGLEFKVSVLGESFSDVPDVFHEAKEKLGDRILHFGRLDSKEEYFKVLSQSDVAVSTADHEFFGVAMVESALCGSYPLCPKRLSYPEIFPDENLYSTDQQMFKILREFCKKPWVARRIWNPSKLKIRSFDELTKLYLCVFDI